jgi:GTP-binding protein
MVISSSAHQGLKQVLRALEKHVVAAREQKAEAQQAEDDEEAVPTIRLSGATQESAWNVTKQTTDEGETVFVVSGEKIEKFARRTNFAGTWQDVNRLRDIMKKMGISHELTRQGAVGNSIIVIGDNEFSFVEQQ